MTPAWLLALASTATSSPPPSATFRALEHALTHCFQAPPHADGSAITVRFSLKRDGSVFGVPRVTYARLAGTAEDQALFRQAVVASLDACTPVRLSPALAATIAGHPLTILFSGDRPVLSINGS